MKTALVVIDVQMAFVADDEAGAARSCPQANDNITALLESFRSSGQAVVHVHHHGTEPDDPFFGEGPGAAVQSFAAPVGDEKVFIKHTSSAFVGTGLESYLRDLGVERLVLCGAAANYCVDSTARSAGDLGFDTYYVSDAVWTYDETGPDGTAFSAAMLQSASMANLNRDFATVALTQEILTLS